MPLSTPAEEEELSSGAEETLHPASPSVNAPAMVQASAVIHLFFISATSNFVSS